MNLTGGIQQKLTAAKSLDINKIIIPYGNKSEFMELPESLKKGLTVYFVKEYQEVYDVIFGEDAEAVEKIEGYGPGTSTSISGENKPEDVNPNQEPDSERDSHEVERPVAFSDRLTKIDSNTNNN